MKALLLDIGNSRLKWGLYKDGAIYRSGHLTLERIRAGGLPVLAGKLPRDVTAVLACNVAGEKLAAELAKFVRAHCGQQVQFLRSQAQAYGVTNAYRRPGRLGVDRWVAMIAARARYDTSCLVVDAGTALTIDALDDTGRHLGGQILPGIAVMTEALGKNTSDLPKARKRISRNSAAALVFANSTSTAITQGAIAAAAGAIERALRMLRQRGHRPVLLLTGGDATLLQAALAEESELCPHLVLEGLAHHLSG